MNVPLTGYTVVRYVTDLGRNEPRNVGIIVWNKDSFLVRFDGAALNRLIREHSGLTLSGLASWEGYLLTRLVEAEPAFSPSWIAAFLENQPAGIPVSLSEARYTTGDEGLETKLERLLERLVR